MPEPASPVGAAPGAMAPKAVPPEMVAQHATLDRSLLTGVVWTGSVKWIAQALTWASTFVVARLLTPADYGIVAMAALYMGLVQLLSEFGVGSAIVTLRKLAPEQVAQINTLAVMLGATGFVISCLAAYPLSLFFNSPQLPWVIVAMSTAFVITSFRVVPWALLQRDLRFKRLAAFEGAQALVLAAASVVFALAGFRYWTLVLANVIGALISTSFVLYHHRHSFARPRRESLGEVLGFSRNILISRTSFYWWSNADNLMVGRLLGQAALGAYNLGYTLAMTPLEKTSGLILRVTPAIFSSVQNDRDGLRRYWLGITEAIALVTFPLTWGLALVAPDFVPLALGDRWRAMIVPTQVLLVYAAFRSLFPIAVQLLIATRKSKSDAKNSLQTAVAMPVAFLIGGYFWGITGVAVAWVVVHPYFGSRLVRWALKRVDLPPQRWWQALWPALSSALIMAVAVLGAGFVLPDDLPAISRLVLKIATGAVAYSAALLVFHRHRLLAFRELAKKLRK
jgi:PST family polysaccharide transporter